MLCLIPPGVLLLLLFRTRVHCLAMTSRSILLMVRIATAFDTVYVPGTVLARGDIHTYTTDVPKILERRTHWELQHTCVDQTSNLINTV